MTSSLRAGPDMMTFLAPPLMWAAALGPSVNRPVDSMTISTPTLFQGILPGSLSAKTFTSWPSTRKELSDDFDRSRDIGRRWSPT